MSESLRNDGRVWVPKKARDSRKPHEIPEEDRDYYLERKYPSFGNLAPRDIASRSAKEACDKGLGVGESGLRSTSILQMPLNDMVNKPFVNVMEISFICTNVLLTKTHVSLCVSTLLFTTRWVAYGLTII